MKGPLFYSKILLFGEYGIIKDSKGLSIPYNFYKGALKYSQTQNDISADSNSILQEYYQYLKTLDNDLVRFNLDQMALDISQGMYFDSSIPRDGPLLGLFAFGIFTNYKVKDQWVWIIALLSVLTVFGLGQISAVYLGGYEIGYELLPLNGILTFFGLVLIRKK